MSELDVAVALVGLIVVVTALVSRPLERLPVSRPLVALGVGVALGPAALGLLDAHAWHPSRDVLVREVSRLTIAIGLMAVALRLPRGWFRAHWRPVSLLLLVLMPLMWLATSAVVRLVLGFDWWTSLLIGAVLTPTDPVAASAIVTGPLAKKALPERLRHLLSAESGANDGLALPLVMIGILVLTKPMESAVHEWLTHVLLVEVLLGAVIGLALGLVVGRAFRWADEHKDMEVSSFLAVTLALALLALGAAKLAGGSGVLAVFVAGIAFDSQTRSKERHEEEKIQEAVNLLFTVPAFGLLGLLLPWNEWLAMGPAALAAVVLILLLRRLPATLALSPLLRAVKAPRDALWFGWFGPLGVAAMLYAALAHERTHVAEVWSFATLAIVASLVAHGVTAGPLTVLYGRAAGRTGPSASKGQDEE